MGFEPTPQSTSISIPISFDYRGGRSQDVKNKVLSTLVIIGLFIFSGVVLFGIMRESNVNLWWRIVIFLGITFVLQFILRYFIYKEQKYSDNYEELKRVDNQPDSSVYWNIFDIDYVAPYTVYFQNGRKGIFVKMERGPISGKSETAVYDHYEAVGEGYRLEHAYNMDIVSIDYMDIIGNDPRINNSLKEIAGYSNPDMVDLLTDMFIHLQESAERNYTSYDVYLFLSKDKFEDFYYNVKSVVNSMLNGNYITYSFLDRDKIRELALALFNLHDLSVNDNCETVLTQKTHKGIVPISIQHADGSIETLGKTTEQKRQEAERAREQQLEEQRKRTKKKPNKATTETDSEIDWDKDLHLFD